MRRWRYISSRTRETVRPAGQDFQIARADVGTGMNYMSDSKKWTSEKVVAVANIVLVFVTIWMVYETRRLIYVQLYPFIAPQDVELQVIDKGGTPFSISWVKGPEGKK